MKYIYYPEYELEYRQLLDRRHPPDHILNIRLLMFLCDHVVLPPSHLLYTDCARILELEKSLGEFFRAGRVVSIDYARGMDDYFTSRTDRIPDPIVRRAKEMQAELIRNRLLTNDQAEHNRTDEKTQLVLFDTHLRELLADSGRHKKQSRLILEQMDTLSDQSGEAVHSTQFRDILTGMRTNSDLSGQQNRYFMTLMSNAYYFSGTYTMNTVVSYNPYFRQIDLRGSLIRTHEKGTSLIVDPYFMGNLLSVMGIRAQDILGLSLADYQDIMSHEYWADFLALFEIVYESAQELDAFLGQEKNSLEKMEKCKEMVYKILDTFFNGLVLPIGLCLSFTSPVVQIGVPLVITILRMFFPPVRSMETAFKYHASDRFVEHIQRGRDPLYEFCYRLKSAVRELP